MHRRDVIKGRLKAREEAYDQKVSFNVSAWNTYGSELAPGSMMASEKTILEEIRHLEMLLSMPEVDMNQEALLERFCGVEKEIAFLQRGIDRLEKRKGKLTEEKRERKECLKRIGELMDIPLER